jgi:ketosteroid isomerase-like protein
MKQVIVFLLALFFISCNDHVQPDTEVAVFNMEEVKAHIVKMNESYSRRFTTNDTAFYKERYCKDAEVYSPGVAAVKGRDSIRTFFYQNGTNTETKIELPAGKFYGNENIVVEEGTYNFPDGKGGSFDKGKFIAIWKKEDGEWKLYREIWNTDISSAPSK